MSSYQKLDWATARYILRFLFFHNEVLCVANRNFTLDLRTLAHLFERHLHNCTCEYVYSFFFYVSSGSEEVIALIKPIFLFISCLASVWNVLSRSIVRSVHNKIKFSKCKSALPSLRISIAFDDVTNGMRTGNAQYELNSVENVYCFMKLCAQNHVSCQNVISSWW